MNLTNGGGGAGGRGEGGKEEGRGGKVGAGEAGKEGARVKAGEGDGGEVGGGRLAGEGVPLMLKCVLGCCPLECAAVHIPAVAAGSVLHSAAVGGFDAGVVGPL